MTTYTNDALTITFGENVENHKGNQQIGAIANQGFTFTELQSVKNNLDTYGIESHLVNLGQYLPAEYGKIDTGVLVIRNGVQIFMNPVDLIWNELRALTYDKHAFMYGTVKEKHARHNLCFANFDQTADYPNGKGTVVDFKHLSHLSHVRQYLPLLLETKAKDLNAEANYYYDLTKTYIGFHGDIERKVVVAIRLGHSFPLFFRWHLGKNAITEKIRLDLNHGDIYVMDEKACGNDWLKKKIPTLRHAAGCEKYIK